MLSYAWPLQIAPLIIISASSVTCEYKKKTVLNLSVNRFEMIGVHSVDTSQGVHIIHIFCRCESRKYLNCPGISLGIKTSTLFYSSKLQEISHLSNLISQLNANKLSSGE